MDIIHLHDQHPESPRNKMACVYVEKSTSVDGSFIFAAITGLLSPVSLL